MSCSNTTPNFYEDQWNWYEKGDQVSAPATADAVFDNQKINESKNMSKTVLKEKNKRIKYIHVPHRDKPPQVVAKRNARERNRVQAVNTAFMKLRKAIPTDNNRGKRVSKVKTLKNAIKYIQKLQELLEITNEYHIPFYNYESSNDFYDQIEYDVEF